MSEDETTNEEIIHETPGNSIMNSVGSAIKIHGFMSGKGRQRRRAQESKE